MGLFSFIKKLFKANISVVSADNARVKVEDDFIVHKIDESTREAWMQERHQKDNVSSLMNYDGFHDKVHGRSGTIYYVKDKQLCEIYCEMSGVSEYDLLISFDQLEEWILPQKRKITVIEKESIKEELIAWLTEKRISAEIAV